MFTRLLRAAVLAATLAGAATGAALAADATTAPATAAAPTATASAPTDALADPKLARFEVKPVDDAWRAALPRDADKATQAYMDRLPADVVARSNAYFEGGYWLILWNWLMGIATTWLLLRGRRSARLRAWAQRVAKRAFLADALYTGGFMLASWVIQLPLTVYQNFWREHQYAMATQTFGPWFGEQLMQLAVSLVVSMIAVPLLYKGIRKTGERWWVFGTGFAVTFAVVGMLIAPVFIEPLFNTYKPVQDPTIKAAVLSMAHADGVPAGDVFEFDASRQTTRVSANVSGILGTAAVRLNDNLLRRSSLPEIRAVMGHELGHYVMNHIYKGLTEFGLLLLFGFAFTHWGMKRLLARHGQAWGVTSIGDIASLPLLMAVLSTFMFLATPVLNTMTRVQEIEADRFGLNLSREPLGEAEVDLKLTEYRKPDPSALEEFVFFDHPSTRFRIHDAMRWREAQGTDGSTFTPPLGEAKAATTAAR